MLSIISNSSIKPLKGVTVSSITISDETPCFSH